RAWIGMYVTLLSSGKKERKGKQKCWRGKKRSHTTHCRQAPESFRHQRKGGRVSTRQLCSTCTTQMFFPALGYVCVCVCVCVFISVFAPPLSFSAACSVAR